MTSSTKEEMVGQTVIPFLISLKNSPTVAIYIPTKNVYMFTFLPVLIILSCKETAIQTGVLSSRTLMFPLMTGIVETFYKYLLAIL